MHSGTKRNWRSSFLLGMRTEGAMAVFFAWSLCMVITEARGILPRKNSKCPSVGTCKCLDDMKIKGGINVQCEEATSSDLDKLPGQNITSLTINDSKIQNLSSLGLLRWSSMSSSTNITIRDTNIPVFNWEWIPERLHRLKLTGTATDDMYTTETRLTDGDIQYQCNMGHIKKLKSLYLTKQDKMQTIPSCLPNATQTLVFIDVPLTGLNTDIEDDRRAAIRWPASLTTLILQGCNITRISERIFANPPLNLTRISMKNLELSGSTFMRNLPGGALKHLKLISNSIGYIAAEDFDGLRHNHLLEILDLSYNHLREIPHGMPSSLLTLYLHGNKITQISVLALANLDRLKNLDLNQNIIGIVPRGLPESLVRLDLHKNVITTCDPQAFKHLKNLQILDLSENRLTTMPRDVPNIIKYYYLQKNQISAIGEPSNYEFCASCRDFRLSGNPWSCDSHMVTFLVWAVKHGFEQFSLENMKLADERFTCGSSISTGMEGIRLEYLMRFMHVVQRKGCSYNVTVLDCDKVGLEEYFAVMMGMEEMYISNNADLGNVPNFLFAQQTKLRRVELNWNGLTAIPYGLPESVITLSLVGNKISTITEKDAKALKNLTNIDTIRLDHNSLKTFLVSNIAPLKTLNILSLTENPLVCDCSIWPFTVWLKKKLNGADILTTSRSYGKCANPNAVQGQDIKLLEGYFLHGLQCVPQLCQFNHDEQLINCSYDVEHELSVGGKGPAIILGTLPKIRPSWLWKTIDASDMGLNSSAIQLKHLYGLRHAILSNNSLQSLPVGFPKSLTHLTLDRNNISVLPTPEQLKQDLPNLRYLDIRYNNIKNVNDKNIRVIASGTVVRLQGNPLMCNCDLRPLVAWVSAINESKKAEFYQGLLCSGPKDLAGLAIITLTDADYCLDVRVTGVAGALIGALILFTALAVLINLYLHKKRKRREKRDILQGFRQLLQHEAGFNDEDPETGVQEDLERFMYDAFVSYSPSETDSDFAMMLLDELEIQREYKLCMHERDFVPGIGIADNIVECISSSKRIILILSRNFVSSPWCQYEVQVALAELHQKRRSKLLIPVMLEDIDEDEQVAGAVKVFLSLIKGIKIPTSRKESSWKEFWNELCNAMPETPIQEHI